MLNLQSQEFIPIDEIQTEEIALERNLAMVNIVKIVTPDKLTTEANDPSAEKQYKHWKKTFDNFILDCGEEAPDKLRCLTKYVSADIYEYFAESATYEDAEEVLNNLYLQPKNEIFARHQLAIRKQKASESLEQYIQELRRLSKNIDFKDVTANTYREEMIRDSFINGIESS